MFVKLDKSGYRTSGEQFSSGLFFMLIQDKAKGVGQEVCPLKAIVRKASLRQLGHFMMGTVRILGHSLTISGGYGGDGLPMSVPTDIYEKKGILLPQELYDAWNKGEGWNGPGREAGAMRKWALEHLEELRK